MKDVKLIPASNREEASKYINSYFEACKEFKIKKVKLYTLHNPKEFHLWKNTIYDDFKNEEKGIYKKATYIPSTTFWLVNEEEFIGTGNIRHYLNDSIELLGGHIGYAVKASKWGMGYGTVILSLLLKEAGKMGINPALITCDLPNKASAKVIEKNGGKLHDINDLLVDGEKRRICRYLVDTGIYSIVN